MISKLEEFKVYNHAMEIGDEVWNIVSTWNYFAKDTVGKQLVRAVDSVAANLSEGFGRYHFKEAKNFGYYSRGSLSETETWLQKAKMRNLISDEQHRKLKASIEIIGRMLNRYIQALGDK